MKHVVAELVDEIRQLLTADEIPWIVGYSGGKDSTAALQLVWMAVSGIPKEQQRKTIHVISTDTMVENPVVSSWVNVSHNRMRKRAKQLGISIVPHLLKPELSDTFWVNLIGRGYPAPRYKFRWCTDRLKIRPSNNFVSGLIKENGQAIMVLGVRKAESSTRSKIMKRYERQRVRDRLSASSTLPNCLIYPVISDWQNDDVWMFLMQYENPWGHNNKDLLSMYRRASPDGECPLVIDTSTPSCGNSRFGCWVCTLVGEDKSMSAMIQNDVEKNWMLPLLDFRNDIDFRGAEKRDKDRSRRDYRRMSGAVSLYNDELVPGPYTQEARVALLNRLLNIQEQVRSAAPPELGDIQVVTVEELQEIRRIWVIDKHEIEDHLPMVYKKATGRDYPGAPLEEYSTFSTKDLSELRELCKSDIQYELVRNLIAIERRYELSARRLGIFNSIEDVFKRNFYDDRHDAKERAMEMITTRKAIQELDREFITKIANKTL
jgi:DNA sulfur modification protein DndC